VLNAEKFQQLWEQRSERVARNITQYYNASLGSVIAALPLAIRMNSIAFCCVAVKRSAHG